MPKMYEICRSVYLLGSTCVALGCHGDGAAKRVAVCRQHLWERCCDEVTRINYMQGIDI